MKTLIFGATGLLGKALMREGSSSEIVGFASSDVDIRDAERTLAAVAEERPDWIVLSAAYTDVDGCESDPEKAFAVNRDGALHVADAAKAVGSRMMFLSSDYVFDGKRTTPYETDAPRNPRSVYGRSKAEAEVRLLERLPDCCVVRTSWLFGVGGKCFPDTILKLAANRPALDVVNDQRGCPTYAGDLATAIAALCRKNASGIVHVTNTGECSWFEFALEIVKDAGLSTEVRPVSSHEMARPAPRPAYSVLSPASLRPYGIEMSDWKNALQRYLKERSR